MVIPSTVSDAWNSAVHRDVPTTGIRSRACKSQYDAHDLQTVSARARPRHRIFVRGTARMSPADYDALSCGGYGALIEWEV